MPRRRRELTIRINETNMKDAFVRWVRHFHQIDINAKTIEFDIDEHGKVVGMTAIKTAHEDETNNQQKNRCLPSTTGEV